MSFSYRKYVDENCQGDFVIITRPRNKSFEIKNEEHKTMSSKHKSTFEKIVDKYDLSIEKKNEEIKIKNFSSSNSSPPILNFNFNECKSESIKSHSKSSSNSKSIGKSISLEKENSLSNSNPSSRNISPQIIIKRVQIPSINQIFEQENQKKMNDDSIQMNISSNRLLETEQIDINSKNDIKVFCSELNSNNSNFNMLIENYQLPLFNSIQGNSKRIICIVTIMVLLIVLLIIIIV